MKTADAKKLIGKRVEYWMVWDVDPRRGTVIVKTGKVTDVQGRNIEISGDWKSLSSIAHLKEIEPA